MNVKKSYRGIFLLTALALHAQTPGTITSHSIPSISGAVGASAIDAQQNVYIAAGGAALGQNCTPMSIVKDDASGHQVFSKSGPITTCGVQTGITDLTVDHSGNVYVVGIADSAARPNGFAAKLSADGTQFLYTTSLPANLATPAAVRVDAQGAAYIAGTTSDFHPFVTKLSADGSTSPYTTVLAGAGTSQALPDSALALAVDDAGDAFVTGQASSSDFPTTAGASQPSLPASPSGFIAKLDPSGKIVFSTFLGGHGGANGQAIGLDSAGNIYVAGDAGPGFPTTAGTYQPVASVPLWSNGPAAFVARLRPDGSAITWATYTFVNGNAGNSNPSAIKLAVSPVGEVYLASSTGAGFVTTSSAPQPCFGLASDVVLIHLTAQGTLANSTFLGATRAHPLAMGLPGDGSIFVAETGDSGASVAQVRFGGPGWTPASCLSPDVVNAASFSADGLVSPGELVSLTGFGIGPESGLSYQAGPHGEVPVSLGGVQVFFNGIPAPLLYVQAGQVNAQVPFEVFPTPPSNSKVTVTLTYGNNTFGPYSLDSNSLGGVGTGGIFRLQPGASTQAAALNQDGTVNTPQNPAPRGTTVTFFGTGYGPLAQSCATGGLNPPGPAPLVFSGSPITIPVQYAGSAPTLLCGIVQFNVEVPLDALPGPFLLTPYVNPGYGSIVFVQ